MGPKQLEISGQALLPILSSDSPLEARELLPTELLLDDCLIYRMGVFAQPPSLALLVLAQTVCGRGRGQKIRHVTYTKH